MALRFNPFAVRKQKTDPRRADTPIEEPPSYSVPQSGAYGVPALSSGAPYITPLGWGVTLRTSTTEIPSAQRLQAFPRKDYRPDPVRPPEEFWEPKDADTKRRHSVEKVDADGWTEAKGVAVGDRRWKENPRLTPPPEPRPTTKMAPRSYSFERPFDQHAARYFNGQHFSMADHRRNYEILGMSPVRTLRNTYRLEPIPWDQDIVDMPPSREPDTVQARLTGVEVPYAPRTWRLR